jgi:predicted DNA-binding antitoxin AbrB/MazE fold protein
MIQHIKAIYDQGLLKPLEPLDLKDQEVVFLSIDSLSDNGRESCAVGPTLFEMLDEAGLIGCVKGAPADLSTNPKHMEGFGTSGD